MIFHSSASGSLGSGGRPVRLATQTVHDDRSGCGSARVRARLQRGATQRGATMVSVMLLMVSLVVLGLLVVRSAVRQVTQAGQLVARERALLAAQATLELATAQYVAMGDAALDAALLGTLPQGASCVDPCGDCIPDDQGIVTGQRNELLAGAHVSCGGRPCMRQGAVSLLRDDTGTPVHWCDLPLRDLLTNADPEARVSAWVRNNSADALGGSAGAGTWIDDEDGRVVLTAMATVRGTTVTLEQEVMLSLVAGAQPLLPQTPDEGYGGGHNNDGSTVSVCIEDYVAAAAG